MTVVTRVQRADERLFRGVARHDHGVFDRGIPALTTAADHGRLWFVVAAALAFTGPRGRRAAVRGLASLGVASALANGPAKWAVRRRRPLLVDVPSLRQLRRQPVTTSFPSGHAASAAAFAMGVALESPLRGAPVAALAAGVAYGRVHTGVHYPSDVAAGLVLGAAAAAAVRRWWPVTQPRPARVRPADAPALPDGEGLVVVVNETAGSADGDDVMAVVTERLPRAQVVRCGRNDDLSAVLRTAATHARVLGVAGGDGTINCAASVALAEGVPLAVLPAGTLNHFAADLGLDSVEDVTRAIAEGRAVEVPVGSAGEAGVFLNTFSLGVYPELVRHRERHERWAGKWPALAIALGQALRADPVTVEVDGVSRPLWLFFAGNGRYDRSALPTGGRTRLDEAVLDVRMVHADRGLVRLRVALAALTGRLHRSPAYACCVTDRVALAVDPGTGVALDGEARAAPRDLVLEPADRRLVVYCPAPG